MDKKKRYVCLTLLVAGMVFGAFVLTSLNYNPEKKSWKLLTTLASDVDPGNGQDGIVNVYIYPLASKSDVNTGCSEATAYEHGDDVDGFDDGDELAGSTPVSSTYFIAIEVQFSNKAYNSTSSDWDLSLVKAEITSSDLSLSAVTMEEGSDFFDQDGTTDAKLTFYVDNSDNGWTMTTGLHIDVDDVDIYYYG